MDYEKAYTNAVARAKQAIKDCGHNEGRKRMIEDIFPELKESEDERIRKELIRLLNVMTDGIIENYTPIPLRDLVAWLEKQGEPQPYRGNADTMRKNLIKAFKSVGSNHWGGFDVRDIIHFLESKDAIELEKQGEKKPAKRSDKGFDDFFNLESVIDIVEMYGKGEVRLYGDDVTSELEWLKSLRDRLQPQPKQEWSEEDEFILKDAIAAIDMMLTSKFQESNPNLYKSFEVAKHWLKSLKPQPQNWKPSDEQMETLDILHTDYVRCDDWNMADKIKSLYNDLKNFEI